MKKIIFLFTLVISIAMISGYKQSAQNEMAEKLAKPAIPKNLKGINKPVLRESKAEGESFTANAPENKPQILLMLTNDTGLAKWSPSLWWNYHHANSNRPGC